MGVDHTDNTKRKGFTRAVREAILKRDGYRCRYCGDNAETVDHVIPVAFVPIHTAANLVAACGRCNRKASDMVFLSLNEKREFILENSRSRTKKIPIWLLRDVAELGHTLKTKILAECLIVSTEKEASHVSYYLEQMGLEPVTFY